MTLLRQECSLVADDLDHQVRLSEGVHVNHSRHHKNLPCSLCVGAIFFLGFEPFSLISSRFRGVLWSVGPSSIPIQYFSGKVALFIARSYFSDFQRLVQVRSVFMTNTQP